MASLGEKIKYFRQKAGLKQEDVANLLGKSKNVISNWERGDNKPDADTIERLCSILSVSPNILLNWQDPSQTKDNGFVLSNLEENHIKKYRILDGHGRKAVDAILDIEYDRADRYIKKQAEQAAAEAARLEKRKDAAAWTSPSPRKYPPNVLPIEDIRLDDSDKNRITLPIYDAGASAGTGVFLDSSTYEVVSMPDDWTTSRANFGVWVDGDSMEPRFSNGDLVLVRTQPTVEIGDIGIFVLNGEGYIKKLGKNKLVSLNPAYDDIEINEWDVVYCKGKVLGKA